MADDHTQPPRPRPRRRRTDIDPNAPTPPVAHERRRQARPTEDTEGRVAALGAAAAGASAAPPGESATAAREDHEPQATTPFHVPGLMPVVDEERVTIEPSAVAERAAAQPSTPDERAAAVAVAAPEERPSWLALGAVAVLALGVITRSGCLPVPAVDRWSGPDRPDRSGRPGEPVRGADGIGSPVAPPAGARLPDEQPCQLSPLPPRRGGPDGVAQARRP